MEDAYVVDQQAYGNFAAIGYEKPTSTVFTYTDEGIQGFKATSTVLDKCAGQTWTVTVNSVTGGKASYTASNNCPTLTPNFQYIGSSKAD